MKKSFLNVFAVAVIFSLALVSCDKTKKAVQDVNENTQEVVQEATEEMSAELDTLKQEVDTLQQAVTPEATEEEAK